MSGGEDHVPTPERDQEADHPLTEAEAGWSEENGSDHEEHLGRRDDRCDGEGCKSAHGSVLQLVSTWGRDAPASMNFRAFHECLVNPMLAGVTGNASDTSLLELRAAV